MSYEIVWFAGRPIAQVTPAGPALHTFTDHLGTPVLQTDAAGTIIWRAEYEPFGNVYEMREGSRTSQPLRFPGQEVAMTWEGSEERYNVFRWYKSAWGAYTQNDPIDLVGYVALLGRVGASDINGYSYASNVPTRFIDPTGAVRWSKKAPVYRTLAQDPFFYTCGPASHSAAGCTLYRGSRTRGKCPCVAGATRLEITLSLSVQVYVRNDDPRTTIARALAEEQKHVDAATGVFDEFIRIGESYEKVYPSASACWAAYAEFEKRFAKRWNRAHKDVDASHPDL